MLPGVRPADGGRRGPARVGDAEGVGVALGEGGDGDGSGGANHAGVGHPHPDDGGRGAGAGDDKVGKVQAQLPRHIWESELKCLGN